MIHRAIGLWLLIVVSLACLGCGRREPVPRIDTFDIETVSRVVSWRGELSEVTVAPVAPDFPGLREVAPLLGRLFITEDKGAAVLSYEYWQRAADGTPDVIGDSLMIDGEPVLVVGILPEGVSKTLDVWLAAAG